MFGITLAIQQAGRVERGFEKVHLNSKSIRFKRTKSTIPYYETLENYQLIDALVLWPWVKYTKYTTRVLKNLPRGCL